MKKRMISIVLALCLCVSSKSVSYARQESSSGQEDVLKEEAASGLGSRNSSIPSPKVWK